MVYHYRCLTFGGFVRLGNKQVKQPTHPSNQLHLALILTRPNGEDTLRRPHAHLNVNEIDIVGWLVGWLISLVPSLSMFTFGLSCRLARPSSRFFFGFDSFTFNGDTSLCTSQLVALLPYWNVTQTNRVFICGPFPLNMFACHVPFHSVCFPCLANSPDAAAVAVVRARESKVPSHYDR